MRRFAVLLVSLVTSIHAGCTGASEPDVLVPPQESAPAPTQEPAPKSPPGEASTPTPDAGTDAAADAAPDAPKPPNGDVTAPTVTLVTTPNDATITTSQTFTWWAEATDAVGVTKIEVFKNGVLEATCLQSPCQPAWWTLKSKDNGTLALSAKAYDAAGNVSEVKKAITIALDTVAPTVSLTSSMSPVKLPGAITLTATATDNKGVALVRFYRGAGLIGTSTAAPYTATAFLDETSNGANTFRAEAEDADGNVASATTQVNVAIATTSLKWISGTSAHVQRVAVDASGAIYAAGTTFGTVGPAMVGKSDGYVRKYDALGAVAWTRNIGVAGGHSRADGLAVDGQNRLVVGGKIGTTAFLRVYATNGDLVWERVFGTTYTSVEDLAVDAANNIVVVGSTTNLDGVAFGLGDAFVRKYDANGNVLWSRQFGTASEDKAVAVAIASDGTVWAGGDTGGSLLGTWMGGRDGWLRSYSATGVAGFQTQLAGLSEDSVNGLAVDAANNVLVVGDSPNGTSWGFLEKRDASGNVLFTHRPASTGVRLYGVTVLANGTIVTSGETVLPFYRPVVDTRDGLLMSFDGAGNVVSGKQYSFAYYEGARGIARTASGFVIGGLSYVPGGSAGYVWSMTNALDSL